MSKTKPQSKQPGRFADVTGSASLSRTQQKCVALMRLPIGYHVLPSGSRVVVGDLWLRPTDATWIEAGTAHYGMLVGSEV